MNQNALKWRKTEFEARIFISMSIAAILCFCSFVLFQTSKNNLVQLGTLCGLSEDVALRTGYFFVAFLMLLATLLRMWAGSHLSSNRIMAFKVQHDVLAVTGPFRLVRNPVYLADLIAYTGFALCLTPIGLLLPVFISIHYVQLIKYEERKLQQQFGTIFNEYKRNTPRILPGFRLFFQVLKNLREIYISYDGFRNNALYLLFVPGFILTAFTGKFIYVLVLGLPAVLDWAIIHTIKGVESYQTDSGKKNMLTRSKMFKKVLYAQCWEDPEIDLEAFNIQQDDVIFSITSGGCNVLAFLAKDPAKIIALDLNPYQNFMLDLKIAVFKTLSYEDVLEFLGVTPSENRIRYYSKVKNYLSPKSREFWDQNTAIIYKGVIHCGHFEKYMHLLKTAFNLLMGKSVFEKVRMLKTVGEREHFYQEKWRNRRWKIFTRLLLSRTFMSLLFDKAFFKELEESFSFGQHFEQIIKRAVTRFALDENSFLHYIVFGNYSLNCLPFYLRKENFETIRSRLNRIEIAEGDCLQYFVKLPDNTISRFNFTNIFEWMPRRLFSQILHETIRIARNKSVITYRNLLVPRSRPENLARFIVPQQEKAEQLYDKDKSFMYRKYVVEEILK